MTPGEQRFMHEIQHAFIDGVVAMACLWSILQDIGHVMHVGVWEFANGSAGWVPPIVSGPLATVLFVFCMRRQVKRMFLLRSK